MEGQTIGLLLEDFLVKQDEKFSNLSEKEKFQTIEPMLNYLEKKINTNEENLTFGRLVKETSSEIIEKIKTCLEDTEIVNTLRKFLSINIKIALKENLLPEEDTFYDNFLFDSVSRKVPLNSVENYENSDVSKIIEEEVGFSFNDIEDTDELSKEINKCLMKNFPGKEIDFFEIIEDIELLKQFLDYIRNESKSKKLRETVRKFGGQIE